MWIAWLHINLDLCSNQVNPIINTNESRNFLARISFRQAAISTAGTAFDFEYSAWPTYLAEQQLLVIVMAPSFISSTELLK